MVDSEKLTDSQRWNLCKDISYYCLKVSENEEIKEVFRLHYLVKTGKIPRNERFEITQLFGNRNLTTENFSLKEIIHGERFVYVGDRKGVNLVYKEEILRSKLGPLDSTRSLIRSLEINDLSTSDDLDLLN